MTANVVEDSVLRTAASPDRVFLTAEWRDLVMLNWEIDPSLLIDRVPRGTTLDTFNGKTYVSLVAFRFLRTRLYGRCPIPFHSDFDEINLRFYVRREVNGELRRGVVFIAELVPKRAVAAVARLFYGENYIRAVMQHRVETQGQIRNLDFTWKLHGSPCHLHARVQNEPFTPAAGSLEQFITEHYWGYASQKSGRTVEYFVDHVPWKVWEAETAGFHGDPNSIYGRDLSRTLQRSPDSAFVAQGSPVTVFRGRELV